MVDANSLPVQELRDQLETAFSSNRFQEVIILGQKILHLRNEDFRVLKLLGIAYEALGKPELSLKFYANAYKLNRFDEELVSKFAVNLSRSGKSDKAIEVLEPVVQKISCNPVTNYNLGVLLVKAHRYREALDQFQTALKNGLVTYQILNNLAIVYSTLGEKEKAINSIKRSLKENPKCADSYRMLTTMTKLELSNPYVRKMMSFINSDGVSVKDSQLLSFALAKVHHDEKEYNKAFSLFQKANSLRKIELGYNIEKDQKLFSSIRYSFDRNIEGLKKSDLEGKINRVPIFIVGMPRSGTTLTEQILSSHSNIQGCGEMDCLSSAVVSAKGLLAYAGKGDLVSLRNEYLNGVSKYRIEKPLFVDKMPLNFRWVGYIRCCLPEARIVHIVRDPRATCWSIYQKYFSGTENGYAYDLEDLVKYYQLYKSLMSYWDKCFPGEIYHLKYESLTENTELEVRKLLQFIGLDWEEDCLKFHENKRAIATASSMQVREKIYQGSSLHWENYAEYLAKYFSPLEQYVSE